MKKSMLVSLAVAGSMTLGATAFAQERLDVHIVSGISDITQFDGQFAAGVIDVLESYEGAEVTVSHSAPSGGMEDELGMDAILRDMVTVGPDYLLFVVVHWETVHDRLVALQEAGVNLMVVEFAPEDAGAVDPFAWAITDHGESGRVTGASAAMHYCAGFEGDAVKAALFHGTSSSEIGIVRIKGIREAFAEGLAECGKSVDYVTEVYANFNRERAFELAQQVATADPDINIIFGANSNTALGIMEGLRTIGMLDSIDITGIGGQLEELASICRGEILTAGVRNPRGQGQEAGKAIIAHFEGKPFEKLVLAPQTTVNTCEEIFAFYPVEMLSNPAFRGNIAEDQWMPEG